MLHLTNGGMDIDRFPSQTSPNDVRIASLPSISSVLRGLELVGARNNGNPVLPFSANPESDPRVVGNSFKGLRPGEYIPPWASGESSRPSLHPRRRDGLNHHPPHYDHSRGSPVGRDPGLGAFNQHVHSPKTACSGAARGSDPWYPDQRQVPSRRASGVPPVSCHVQQQQPQPQHHLPPPRLNLTNTWDPSFGISNNNSSSGAAAPGPGRPCPPRLSPATLEPYVQEQCTSINDSENGDSQSEITSSVAETYSRSGSVASPLPRFFPCGRCKLGFKCDSLRRKHEMKHTKPFKCEVMGCKRTQGFSSVNDRNRHMNSVHKMHVSGNAVGYDCQYDNCRENGKIFFRLDNFRNHLKKKHGPTKATGGELEDFLKRAETECRKIQPPDYLTPSPSSTQSLDTRSEPGFSDFSSTPVAAESPGLPPVSPSPRMARREAPPQVPPIPGLPSVPEPGLGGHGNLVPLPPSEKVQEGIDPGSDPMDLDEEEPLAGAFNTAGSKQSGPSTVHSSTTLANTERGVGAIDTNSQATDRRNKIIELTKLIDSLTKERDELVYQEQVELYGQSHPKQPQEARGKAVSKRIPLGRIEESYPGHMQEDGEPRVLASGERSGTSHALRGFIQQEATRDPFPGRLLDPNADTHPSATEAVEKERPHVLSPQGTTTASPPMGTTAAAEVSQRLQLTDSRQIASPTMPSGLWTQRRPSSPAKQTTTLKFSADRNLTHPKMKPAGVVKGPAICQICTKPFGRPSELKKHMKRHSRPFACTFRGCGKSFGSKNDWKRHENSQHFQLELWKCAVLAPKSASLCGKLSFRRESHITHLKNAHNITDKTEISTWTSDAHIGRNNFKTFWCGFCTKKVHGGEVKGCVVRLEKRGLEGWDERFDHLGAHFEAGDTISSYTFHEDDDFGDAPSTEDDDEDEDAGDEDEAMPDSKLVSSLPQSQADAMLILSIATPQHERGERLQPVKPVPGKRRKTEGSWYCCCSQRGRCADPGPYNMDLHDSCIECGHQRCDNCECENNVPP